MSLLLAHLCLSSLVVGLLALLAKALLPRLWSRPVAGYWLALAAIVLGLLGSGTQILLQGRGLLLDLPLAREVVAVGQELGRSKVFQGSSAPGAEQEGGENTQSLSQRELTVLASLLSEAEHASSARPELQPIALAKVDDTEGGTSTQPWTQWLAGLYLVGLSFALLNVLRQTHQSCRLLREAHPVEDARQLAVWQRIPERPADIRLREVPGLTLPACTGLFRRTILLPPPKHLPSDENSLRCILTHELVHLQRGDAWGLLLQEFFRVLFWFHPAAWWLIGQLDLMRELSCDQLVVQRTKLRKGYAEALLSCAAGLGGGQGKRPMAHNSVALVPLTRSETQLRRRIEMLFHSKSSKSGRSTWLTVGLAGSAASLLCFSQVALAAGFGSSPQQAETVTRLKLTPISGQQSETAREDPIDVEVRKLVELAESGKLEDAQLNEHVQNILRLALAEEQLDAGVSEEIARAGGELATVIHGAVEHGLFVADSLAEGELDLGLADILEGVTVDLNLDDLLGGDAQGSTHHGQLITLNELFGDEEELAEISKLIEVRLGSELVQLKATLGNLSQMIEAKDWAGLAKIGTEAQALGEGHWKEFAHMGEQLGHRLEARLGQAEAGGVHDLHEHLNFPGQADVHKELKGLSNDLAEVKDVLSALGLSKTEALRGLPGDGASNHHELRLLKEFLGQSNAPREHGVGELKGLVQKAMKLRGIDKHTGHHVGPDVGSNNDQHVIRLGSGELVELLKLAESLQGDAQKAGHAAHGKVSHELKQMLELAKAREGHATKLNEQEQKRSHERNAKRELEHAVKLQEKQVHELEAELKKREAEVLELKRRIERERRHL